MQLWGIMFAELGKSNLQKTGMSGNGDKIVFTSQSYNDDTKYFFRIDLTTAVIDKELIINTSDYWSNFNCAVNQDGSKMLYQNWFVDFDAGNFHQLSTLNGSEYYKTSTDGTKLFALTFNGLKTINFESGELINEFHFLKHIMRKLIATTDGKKIITFDGLFSEYGLVLNIDNNIVSFDKTFSIGCDPEGDGSRQIQITPDGKKAVISNTISCSITIVDLVEKQVEYVIPLETELAFGISAHCGAITADSRYFIATTDKAENIKIIDLNSGEIIKSIKTEISGICQVSITPDGQYAFAGSDLVDMMAKIRLDGAASELVQTFPTTAITSAYGGEFSPIKITPDGATLIKTGLDNTLNLYSTDDGTQIKSIDLGGGFYGLTHTIAYNSDCTLALITVSNSIVVVRIDGVNSEIINSQQVVDGNYEYAWGASYNKKYNHFSFFTSDGKFMQLNPEDNSIGINVQIPDNGNLTLNGIDIDKNGKELYYYTKLEDVGNWSWIQKEELTIFNPEDSSKSVIQLPINFRSRTYSDEAHIYAGVFSGPDLACFVFFNETGIAEQLVLPMKVSLNDAYPNPFNPATTITFSLPKMSKVELAVYNIKGQLVKHLLNSKMNAGNHTVNFNATGLNSGVYVYKLKTADQILSKKMILCK